MPPQQHKKTGILIEVKKKKIRRTSLYFVHLTKKWQNAKTFRSKGVNKIEFSLVCFRNTIVCLLILNVEAWFSNLHVGRLKNEINF